MLVTALATALVASPDPAPAAPAPIRLEGEFATSPSVEETTPLVVVPPPTFLIGSEDTTPDGPAPDDTPDPDDSPDASADDDD